jgi:ecotin
MYRYFIYINEPKEDEFYKIELEFGFMKMVDCNLHWISGELIQEITKSGYLYYIFKPGSIISSNKGCPPDYLPKYVFVSYKNAIIDYGENFPIVIYLPTEYKVKYNIFTSSESIE